jgi:hypothetical protein
MVLVAGGVADAGFTTTDAMDLYTGETTGTLLDASFTLGLNNERALGAAAELGGGDVVIVGGVVFDDASGTMQLEAVGSVELLNW